MPEATAEEPVSITENLDTENVVVSVDGEALHVAATDPGAAPSEEIEEEEAEPAPEGFARLDIHLREALRVIVDAVEIGQQPQFAERIPLTARTTTGG